MFRCDRVTGPQDRVHSLAVGVIRLEDYTRGDSLIRGSPKA